VRAYGRLRFDGTDRDGSFAGACWFTDIVVGKDSQILPRRTNLRRASFLGTDVSKLVFEDVRWWRRHSRGRRWLARQALWDESRAERGDFRWSAPQGMSGKEDATPEERQAFYEGIAATYRQLVLNYEAKRAYETAEDFYVGEMETRRRQIAAESWRGWRWWPSLRRYGSSFGLYLVLSRYGSSYWQALGMLLVMVALFAGGFMGLGFRQTREGVEAPPASLAALPAGAGATAAVPAVDATPVPRVVAYRFVAPWSPEAATAGELAADYRRSVSFVLSIATFQRDRFYEPTSVGGQLWLYLAVVAITSQIALILFAIRRRFKR